MLFWITIFKKFEVKADFRVTAGTPFYSWIYTIQSHDLDTFCAFDTSLAKDKYLYTMAWNHLFKKIIYRLNILLKLNPIIIYLSWYDCDISSRESIIFHKKGLGKCWGGGWRMVKWQRGVGVGEGWG